MNESKPTKTALIAGCGIAGPAVALFLQRVGIESVIYEARDAPDDEAGAFLNLAPNGLDVLQTLGLADRIRGEGFSCPRMVLWSGTGKRLGEMFNGAPGGTAAGVMVRRGALNRALREEAVRQGIRVEFGRKLRTIDHADGPRVSAQFDDGTVAEADLLIGCDGIHSRVRRAVFPKAPAPSYTGLIGTGGVAHNPRLAPTPDAFNFVFGKRAFFGYSVRPSGEVFWFNNMALDAEPTREEFGAITNDEWRRRLLDLHADDAAPVPDIVRSITGPFLVLPICDIPSLPAWHAGRVVLVGDAAHATSPHAGQGASMALEDAVVLAKCLRDVTPAEGALAAFQRLRKGRVEAVAALARRIGRSKGESHPLVRQFRDLVMPVVFKFAARSKSDPWGYSYRVDWNERVA